jgi:hypothetical protein
MITFFPSQRRPQLVVLWLYVDDRRKATNLRARKEKKRRKATNPYDIYIIIIYNIIIIHDGLPARVLKFLGRSDAK